MFIQVTFTHRVCNTSLSNFLGIISPFVPLFHKLRVVDWSWFHGVRKSLSVPNSGGGLPKHGGHGSSSSFSVTVIGSRIHSSWPRHRFTFSVLYNTSPEWGSLRRQAKPSLILTSTWNGLSHIRASFHMELEAKDSFLTHTREPCSFASFLLF